MANSIGTSFTPTSNGTSGWSTGSLGDLIGLVPGIGFDIVGTRSLGGGMRGFIPQPIQNVDNFNDFSQTRFTLREAWNTRRYGKGNNRIITPFRAVNNAGDLLSRQNYACGGPCQAPQSRPNISTITNAIGGNSNSCRADVFYSAKQVNPGVPSGTCNTRYVYDASDYTRYLKQLAMNKNYNDRSYGCNRYSTSQSSIRAISRY
jgi:hypothetical protein